MVRLQLKKFYRIGDINDAVSIPLWFDYNQFADKNTTPIIICLNSTMVRLQPY